ncbi:MAG: DUF1963 domain-containing protein [Gulosibacter sp.]
MKWHSPHEGCLYFWIHSDDLENKRFERSWQMLQS